MDFFHRQAVARRQTLGLLVLFIAAFLFVIVALDLVLLALFAGMDEEGTGATSPFAFAAAHPGGTLFLTLLITAVIGIPSLFKSLQLRAGGGGVAAQSLGGVRVAHDTTDLKRRRLINIVEEMSIASGVPAPEIYVLEREAAINAFAAGHSPANAAIAVTQGALDRLNREELQGVIAHEFSHVLNGDMRINVQLMGWLFGLFVIGLIGRVILRLAPRGKKGGGALLLAALAFVILGYVGMLAGRILQAAVARQRERLADASAVQFTRNPPGLRGALLKIAGLASGSKLASANTDQVAHMLFAPGVRRLFTTHPPLLERIQALDPSVRASDLERLAAQASLVEAEPSAVTDPFAADTAPVSSSLTALTPQGVAAQTGNPEAEHILAAHAQREAFPPDLERYAENPAMARALVLALLLSELASVRAAQVKALLRVLPLGAAAEVEAAAAVVARLAPPQHLPAFLLVFPALRRLEESQRRELGQLSDDLIRADARVEVFEFCLAKLLESLLHDELASEAPHGKLTLHDASAELGIVFAILARFGNADAAAARMAYEAGLQPLLPMERPAYAPGDDWPRHMSAALSRLDALRPLAKQPLIEGLVRTVLRDGRISVHEAQLLRVICAVLHCPMPPLTAV